ncbi:lipoprotein [Methylophilaceae bacterium]|jgi:predicted small lipoprotein YifL|nr:lipoprotein [Methylophilaceae bacterium]|tara:strand:- start:237 stop:389 length:153 start_codon:yes stop_codon:yes gene_type:complete
MKINYIFYLLAISLLVSSCGTKGSLYIPEDKYPQAKVKNNILINLKSGIG